MVSKLKATSFLASTLLFAVACSDSSGPGQATVTGTYTLMTLNGSPIPATFEEEGVSVRVTSGTLTLSSGNTFSAATIFTVTFGGLPSTVSATCNGTFTLNATSLSFTTVASDYCAGGITSASWDGASTITVSDGVDELVYRK